MFKLTIDQECCKGCELCVSACPTGILKMSETFINTQGYHPVECIDMDECIGCASCALTCPDICLKIEKL